MMGFIDVSDRELVRVAIASSAPPPPPWGRMERVNLVGGGVARACCEISIRSSLDVTYASEGWRSGDKMSTDVCASADSLAKLPSVTLELRDTDAVSRIVQISLPRPGKVALGKK